MSMHDIAKQIERNDKKMTDIVERLRALNPLDIDADYIESLRKQRVACEQALAETDTDTLRLIKTNKYLVGIAERGEGRKQLDDESVEQFVLGYVKRIEQQLAAADEDNKALSFNSQGTIAKLRQQLAECQAREKVFHELVDYASLELQLYTEGFTVFWDKVDAALTLPSDSTALDAMLKQAELKGRRESLLEAVQHIRANGGLTYGLENKAKELE